MKTPQRPKNILLCCKGVRTLLPCIYFSDGALQLEVCVCANSSHDNSHTTPSCTLRVVFKIKTLHKAHTTYTLLLGAHFLPVETCISVCTNSAWVRYIWTYAQNSVHKRKCPLPFCRLWTTWSISWMPRTRWTRRTSRGQPSLMMALPWVGHCIPSFMTVSTVLAQINLRRRKVLLYS